MDEDNIIIKLIEKKMKKDGWTALTPDSYASYLFQLSNEDIIETVDEFVREGD